MSWWRDFLRVAGRSTPALQTRPNHWPKGQHFKAKTADGRRFVYCPIGNICSWAPVDYDHEWCHWCGKYFSEIDERRPMA